MIHRFSIWCILLALILPSVSTFAEEGVGVPHQNRWYGLHQGYIQEYIAELEARRGAPDWSLPDEVDLAMGYWWLLAEDFYNPQIQEQLFEVIEEGIRACKKRVDRGDCTAEQLSLLGNLIMMAAQVQVARGNYLSAAGYARRGKHTLEQALKMDPENADTYFSLGLYLYYVDYASALVRTLQRILFFPSGNRRLGLVYLEKAAQQSKRFGPMARVALSAIYRDNDENKHRQALAHLRTLRRDYPESPVFRILTATLLMEMGIYDGARELLDEGLEKTRLGTRPYRPYHQDAILVVYGELEVKDFALDRAFDKLQSLVGEDPLHLSWVRPMALYALGRLHLLAGEQREYEICSRRIEDEDPSNRYAKRMKKLPNKLIGRGYVDELQPVFHRWLRGDLDSAFQQLVRIKERMGNVGILTYLLGELALQRGDTEAARGWFREYLKLGNRGQARAAGWSLIRLGEIEVSSGNPDGGRHYYTQAAGYEGFPDRHVASHRLRQLPAPEQKKAADTLLRPVDADS